MFQFPSNGKAHVHELVEKGNGPKDFSFQFPSNGKAHVHNPRRGEENGIQKVSIPFKRESTCARGSKMFRPGMSITVFQFPSNGKAYMHFASGVTQTGGDLFQFPSNGKAYMHKVYISTGKW